MSRGNTLVVTVKVSKQFLIRLKLNKLPAYRIAQQAEVNPNTLSRLINGIDPVKLEDQRIIAVGQILGLAPKECFIVLNQLQSREQIAEKGGAK